MRDELSGKPVVEFKESRGDVSDQFCKKFEQKSCNDGKCEARK